MLARDAVTFPPPLDGGVISMAQLARYRADAPASKYDVFNTHTHLVRSNVQCVNVESERDKSDYAFMENESTLGAKLRMMAERSERSYREIAKAAGYKGASSVQRYFTDDYDAPALPINVAAKLAKGFKGSPVAPEEVLALAGVPLTLDAVTFTPEAGPTKTRRDIPVYGTALGSLFDYEGVAVEQTFLDHSEVVNYFRRPQALDQRDGVYGIYIQGDSMYPRFQEGEIAFVDGKRPPHARDDVVIFLRQPEGDGERLTACLIKRLVRRTATYIELEQFNPAITFRIEIEKVAKMHRVIPWAELLS